MPYGTVYISSGPYSQYEREKQTARKHAEGGPLSRHSCDIAVNKMTVTYLDIEALLNTDKLNGVELY
jgi:hypothetical protein